MKNFLIGSVVAVLCMGAPAVHADDTHQHEHGSAPDKSMDSAGNSGIAAAHMGKAQERMKQAQAIMAKLRDSKDPAERKKLMQQHTQAMRDTMGMMREMKMDMMGGGQGMSMMGQDKGKAQTGGMMDMHQMMEERMEMMQMMMEQLIERQSQ